MAAGRVLVVDDQKPIVETCRLYLEHAGFDVVVAFNGEQALAEARDARPDLVVLDLLLPRIDGREVCRRLRAEGVTVPIVMLTALATEDDRVAGLELGADDYLVKPFSPRELVARVQAILRRADEAAAARVDAAPDDDAEVLHVGAIAIDVAGRWVRRDGETVHLTPTEFDLLVFLARRPGVVRTREQLLAEVWGYRDGSGARTVDSHVRAIRRKLGNDVIRTVHAVGYSVEDGGA